MPRPVQMVPRARLLVQVTESGRSRSFDWSLPVSPGSEMVVGRSRSTDLTLRDEHVSGRHVQFSVTPDGHALIDLGSTNGTTLNDLAIPPHQPQRLSPGDRIVLGGSAEMSYQVDPSTAPDLSESEPVKPPSVTVQSDALAGSTPQAEPAADSDEANASVLDETPPDELVDDPIATPKSPLAMILLTVLVAVGILGVLGYFAWVLLAPAAE
ncbi:MAG: FHA domain-containing protein [Planctomycetota bacterium]